MKKQESSNAQAKKTPAAKKKSVKSGARKITDATRKKLVKQTLEALREEYPNPSTALVYGDPFQLLVAVILSAQCTDKRVNMVTPTLFKLFPTVKAFADAPIQELEEAIKTCGFYRSKARNISNAAKKIVAEHAGIVPDDFDKLLALPGVGRKTANCVMGNAFQIASGFVVDTHVMRLSRKIGLSDEKTPEKVEADLNRLVPRDEWIDASHRLIYLGRQYCIARRPLCQKCPLESFCLKRP
ncbi:MAG: endonuclease III [Thermoguttaceae bacterium]|jgi:endonuclease-3